MSVILLCVAVILGSSELKPVKWREWSNHQEKENRGYRPPIDTFLIPAHRTSLNIVLDFSTSGLNERNLPQKRAWRAHCNVVDMRYREQSPKAYDILTLTIIYHMIMPAQTSRPCFSQSWHSSWHQETTHYIRQHLQHRPSRPETLATIPAGIINCKAYRKLVFSPCSSNLSNAESEIVRASVLVRSRMMRRISSKV